MRSFKKKMDALDQLVTHAPRPQQPATPAAASERSLSETGRERLDELRRRLSRAADHSEVELLLEQVQSEFGNQVAERLVKELRLDEDETDTT